MKSRTISRGEDIFLPSSATTRSGIAFDPRSASWVLPELGGNRAFTFRKLRGAHPGLVLPVKATLLWFVQHRSAAHAANLFGRFRHFFAATSRLTHRPVRSISDVSLMNYRTASRAHEEYLCTLRGALTKWHSLGYPGIEESAVRYLHQVRLRGNAKGVAVATMDPRIGPLSDLELEAVLESLAAAFATGQIALDDYVAIFLLILIAPRPIQLAAMKLCDLRVSTARDGTRGYILCVPRAKIRYAEARKESKQRPIPALVGELLLSHAEATEKRFEGRLSDPRNAPMFPGQRADCVATPGFAWHVSSKVLSVRLKTALSRIAPVSERTGSAIRLPPIRFRRTLGTRARAEGHGLQVIAELLDHIDLQNVSVYAGLSPKICERIDRKTAFALGPLIKAFQGTPVTTLGRRERRITDPRLDSSMRRPVGCCGSSRTCDFAAPVACYTCRSFRPWIDGPHEEMLVRLLSEHERVRTTCDETIAASLIRSICAAAEVVTACKRQRREDAADG